MRYLESIKVVYKMIYNKFKTYFLDIEQNPLYDQVYYKQA